MPARTLSNINTLLARTPARFARVRVPFQSVDYVNQDGECLILREWAFGGVE